MSHIAPEKGGKGHQWNKYSYSQYPCPCCVVCNYYRKSEKYEYRKYWIKCYCSGIMATIHNINSFCFVGMQCKKQPETKQKQQWNHVMVNFVYLLWLWPIQTLNIYFSKSHSERNIYCGRLWTFLLIFSLLHTKRNRKIYGNAPLYQLCDSTVPLSTFGSNLLKLSHEWNLKEMRKTNG